VAEELPPLLMIGDIFSNKLKLFILEIVLISTPRGKLHESGKRNKIRDISTNRSRMSV
jgi:hypothetical protein